MKTQWDYTDLAAAYLSRADYASDAIDRLVARTTQPGDLACDIGAGAAHLTRMLAERALKVTAVEPNDAMRANGIRRTAGTGVTWVEGIAEQTGQPDAAFALVTFGSSFNVTDRPKALAESARILKRGGWFACMWNHRDIADPVQRAIESRIKELVPSYSYGTRREDQTAVIDASGLFGQVEQIEGSTIHRQTVEDCIVAWRSHATLQRQAGEQFAAVVDAIEAVVRQHAGDALDVPYTTRIWLAPVRK